MTLVVFSIVTFRLGRVTMICVDVLTTSSKSAHNTISDSDSDSDESMEQLHDELTHKKWSG